MEITEIFEKDVSEHVMEVIRDDGVNRHIRFRKPGTMCMHFDLITWPGYLCYTGDMGTYVFRRLHDMFSFFRNDDKSRPYRINRRYWAKKLEAQDRISGITEFDENEFERSIKEYMLGWLRENYQSTTKEERRDLCEAVGCDVLDASGDSGGYRKQIALHDFSHTVNREYGRFYFGDFSIDSTFEKYTHQFNWCCHALEWAIGVYDSAKQPEEMAAA